MTLLVAAVTVLQLRSQAEVARTLEGQDAVSLAFLIDDLHRADDVLAAQAATLQGARDMLRSGGGGQADQQLADERRRLRIAEGLDPVHGPGVVISIDAPLTALDLQDAVNNLRAAGAEAIQVDGSRVVTGSVIGQDGGAVSIDGDRVGGPWTIAAVGDPVRLGDAADTMTRSLRADNRVRSAGYRQEADLSIEATYAQRPFVYGSP